MKRFKTTHFHVLCTVVLFAGLTLMSCNDTMTSAIEKEELKATTQSMSKSLAEAVELVFISDSNTDTYDPLFPATADPNWTSTVCYQGNSFGINATWSNPHKAFEVGPHPWDLGTFDAEWINAANSLGSNETVDEDGNSGPDGHNWTRYDLPVAGNGDFVIQLLADNCSWIYLADENGNSPNLIGYQGAVSTPSEYGVSLDGDHLLTFIIYDGGGAAGGKFRLETTESFGGESPDPIEPTEPVDEEAPTIVFSDVTNSLWSPNHKMHHVGTATATDESEIETFEVTVSSNESANGKGDGNTNSDYDIVPNGEGFDIYVRAERSGKGSGRTYTVTATATDEFGNTASDFFEVQVANNKGRGSR